MSSQDTSQHYAVTQQTIAVRSNTRAIRAFVIIIGVFLLINMVLLSAVGAYQIVHTDEVFPGVSAWGTDLSGMTSQEARVALQNQFVFPESTAFVFRDGDQVWQTTANELGVQFDLDRTVASALDVGRRGTLLASLSEQVTAWNSGITISPVVVYDQSQAENFVRAIAAQIDRPIVDATVTLNGLEVFTTGSQVGREVDIATTVNALRVPIGNLQGADITLTINETQPAIADATDVAVTIQSILSEPLTMFIANNLPGDPGPWVASREALAEALVIERVPVGDGSEQYRAFLNPAQLESFLAPIAPTLSVVPVDARLLFNDDTGQLEVLRNSVEGRDLNVALTVEAINNATLTGQHQVPMMFDVIPSAVPDTATAQELGITELVSSSTTFFAGSSAVRKTNIQTASDRFQGVVIKPGEEFSFNRFLGDVSEESGFEEGLIIYGGRTVKGVGGGVCQVSSTAFQTAFYAGFPIVERWPHGYRVSYYESGEGPGLDATVFSPIVDFRFLNDTPNHLLIETSVNKATGNITWRFYSTSDGRTVQKDGPYISNTVPHGPAVYEENSQFSPGQTKQVDYAVDGSDVTVYRNVYRDGLLLSQDTFTSRYLPWRAVYQVAPGYLPAGTDSGDGNFGDGEIVG